MSRVPAPPPRIYVDTSVFCDLLLQNPVPHPDTDEPRWKSALLLLQAVNDDRVVLAASALVEAEVGCLVPYRNSAEATRDQIRGWFTAPATKWTDVDRFLARDAVALADQWAPFAEQGKKLGGADATHLAAAVRLGCDYLMTQDGGFPIGQTVSGVRVRRPDVVWEETLDDLLAIETADGGHAKGTKTESPNGTPRNTEAASAHATSTNRTDGPDPD
ncbi:PIN domain-containing protein [Gordonia sp. VNK1]|jgi:predicted nucleic acid-binding protein|uniref:type II toxin-antitoxin system VapC family toxin n=1 Tax=Gordonia oleivorans TaxID=3156618 RepID=UPI0032B5BF65